MRKMVENYRKSNVEFDSALQSILKNYNTTELTEEAMADVAGQLFGNQEFINNLSQTNPNLFKRIYNEIKYLWHQFSGYKNQNQFIEDLQYKWEQAYRSSNNLNNTSNFLIKQNSKGSYVKADRQVITGDNPDVWATQVENYINDKIRNNQDVIVYGIDGTPLTISSNTSGKAMFRNYVTMADGTKRLMTDEEYAAKLRAETHIDELAKISKDKGKRKPDFKNHNFARDGFDYRTAYFEDSTGKYYRITMSVGVNGDINTIYNVGEMLPSEIKTQKNETSKVNGSKAKLVSVINNIPQSNKNVKSDTATKYSMQESINDTQELDNQGRTLTKEQQERTRNNRK